MAALDDDDQGPRSTGSVLFAASTVYALLLAMAFAWLWSRDDLDAVAQQAIGGMGLFASAGLGLAAGLIGAAVLAGASRWLPAVTKVEAKVASMLGPMAETPLVCLALMSAIAEELLFRLAGQRALGMPGSVALYVLVNTGPGFWAWAPVAFVFGLLFSLLMDFGCGLLAAATAHALVNYISLRRMLPT